MARRGNLKNTNDHPNDVNDRMDMFEKLVNNQINELQDKIKKLEEQAVKDESRIKLLEDKLMNVQCHGSNGIEVKSVQSTDVQGNMANPSDIIIQREDSHPVLLPITNLSDNTTPQFKPQNVASGKTDLDFQKQERSIIVESRSDTVHVENVQLLDLKNNDGGSNTQAAQNSNTTNEEQINRNRSESETFTRRPVGGGNFVFTRWMNSRDDYLSLWSNDNYRKPLLSYIGKIYGQKDNIRRLLNPLRIEFNNTDELDQLYDVIKKFESHPGAKESLRDWRLQTRPDHRLDELRVIFELSSSDALLLDDWQITPANLKEIISSKSINAYFDLICRDGLVTAEVGEYLGLNKENIFGGNDYNSHNERITLVNVDLSQSTINLANNRVDLITCFVTLHHVPHLNPMLSELVRILQPGGYLILREHDCENKRTLLAKYLNFVHAFMMIAQVGEFADPCANHINQTQDESHNDSENDTTVWKQKKSDIIKYTSSIQYRTRDEWQKELERVGFCLKATLQYGPKTRNPQALYYAVYQLRTK